MGEDMAWDFILDTDSITQINAEEYEKATQNGHPATAESITTVNPDAEDLVYGTYEYKNGSDAFSAEVGYSSGDDCDYIGITHYSNNGTATNRISEFIPKCRWFLHGRRNGIRNFRNHPVFRQYHADFYKFNR